MTRPAIHRSPWLWLVALAVFGVGAMLDAMHAYIGGRIGGLSFLSLGLWTPGPSYLSILSRSLPSWLLMGLSVPLIFRVADRFPVAPGTWRKAVPIHVLVGLAFAGVFVLAASGVRYALFIRDAPTFASFATRYYAVFYNIFFLQYWYVVGLHAAFLYYHRYQRRAVQDAELRARLSEARMSSLRSQLRPHFLFNTLNSISVLSMAGESERVQRMLAELGDLLRLSLAHDGSAEIELGSEIDFIERYLYLQRTRLEDRLDVQVRADAAARRARVPALVLQPLVENSLVHGPAGGRPVALRISGRRRGDSLVVEVSDSGPGFPAPVLEGAGWGVGLSNTHERLVGIHGPDHGLRLDNAPGGGAIASFRIPFRPGDPGQPSGPGMNGAYSMRASARWP